MWCLGLVCIAFIALQAGAHPLDEFCGEDMLDPVLCAELSALDAPAKTSSALPEVDIERSPFSTFALYLQLGIEHILPAGLDHLLFVLALLLSSRRLRSLFLQISLFTVAHTVTIALSMAELLVLPGQWVEVMIALTIAFVGVENLFLSKMYAWRPVVVFIFGLLHGLGFAGALKELGIPSEHFFSALIGFNIGVEIGQLSFALLVFCLLFYFMKKRWYEAAIVNPLSLFVALTGLWWAIERSGLI